MILIVGGTLLVIAGIVAAVVDARERRRPRRGTMTLPRVQMSRDEWERVQEAADSIPPPPGYGPKGPRLPR